MSLHKNILGGIAMGNFNIKGLTPKSVGGVLILLLALINAILQIFGYQPVQIGNDEIYEVVSTLFLIGASAYTTYNNFNVTPASQIAQELTDAIKNGEILIAEVDDLLEKVKESQKESE